MSAAVSFSVLISFDLKMFCPNGLKNQYKCNHSCAVVENISRELYSFEINVGYVLKPDKFDI